MCDELDKIHELLYKHKKDPDAATYILGVEKTEIVKLYEDFMIKTGEALSEYFGIDVKMTANDKKFPNLIGFINLSFTMMLFKFEFYNSKYSNHLLTLKLFANCFIYSNDPIKEIKRNLSINLINRIDISSKDDSSIDFINSYDVNSQEIHEPIANDPDETSNLLSVYLKNNLGVETFVSYNKRNTNTFTIELLQIGNEAKEKRKNILLFYVYSLSGNVNSTDLPKIFQLIIQCLIFGYKKLDESLTIPYEQSELSNKK